MPRSIRWRVTLLGTVMLALVLGGGAAVTVFSLQAALSNDTRTQNEELLEEIATVIEAGADAFSIALPTGADGTDVVILDADGFVMNINDAAFALGREDEGTIGSEEWLGSFDADGPFPGGLEWYDLSDEELLDLTDEALVELAETSFTTISGSEILALDDIQLINLADHEYSLLVEDDEYFDQLEDELNGAVLDYFEDPNWYETTRTVQTLDYGELTLSAFSPIGIISRSVDQLVYILAIVVPVLILLGAVALWAAIGAALRPVKRITEEAARITPSNSTERLPVPDSGDEVAELTHTLNQMLDRLDDGLARQRQFVSDASHELRSPLTAVKGGAGLLVPDAGISPPTKAMTALMNGIDRLELVLDDLTQLATGDALEPTSSVDIGDLVLAEVTALSPPDHVSIDTSQVQHFAAQAFPVPLSRAVRNLLENALRHASGTVAVSAMTVRGSTVLIVEDDGAGVPESDQGRIFERFVRLDDARSRSKGGSGLGLAIVASIAAAHQGSVECDTSPDLDGARFTLRI